MLQHYVTEHAHPQKAARFVTATAAPAVNQLACFSVGAGKAISAESETYMLQVGHTGIAGIMGYYVAQALETVPGYADMVSVCSAAVVLNNLPTDAVVMAFASSDDLASGPVIGITDPDVIWYPLPYDSMAFDNVANPQRVNITLRASWPVENDANLARYFGIAVWGTYQAASRVLVGGISLRQVKTEYPVFMPNK